ncbi:MAG: hypothetical protein OCD01_17580 [Fibrobacterales bacterium]
MNTVGGTMINQLFSIMDKWRQFPSWQLERRADIFFSLYIQEILANRGIDSIRGIIPEFPVRHGDIYKGVRSNRSSKIDFVVFTDAKVFLIELRTDANLKQYKQSGHLKLAQEAGLNTLLEGVRLIYSATHYREKYKILLDELCSIGCMEVSDSGHYRTKLCKKECEVLYIQPSSNGVEDSSIITFDEIANNPHIDGEFGERFKQSLREWSGEVEPTPAISAL